MFTGDMKEIRGEYALDFKEVVRRLSPKEMEDLLVEAYSDFHGRPFVVENIKMMDGKKEISIRYMASNVRKVVEVRSGKLSPKTAKDT